jgi:hypothetical protein
VKFLYVAHIPFVLLFLAFTIGLALRSLLSRDREGGSATPTRTEGAVRPK